MKIPSVTIKQLLEAGVHLGHKTFRWNPKMEKFIFGSKESIHIIDLVQTLELIKASLQEIHKSTFFPWRYTYKQNWPILVFMADLQLRYTIILS